MFLFSFSLREIGFESFCTGYRSIDRACLSICGKLKDTMLYRMHIKDAKVHKTCENAKLYKMKRLSVEEDRKMQRYVEKVY